ncbi:hypothetical protein NIES2101_05675 [Calothrix sp. HK-06]|nr:hypothetical protein NIES2101_05675 [Calothrix sp. HK-06]
MKYNKPVKLEITGAETLIERSILDTTQEPLLHILRNAFDHGIEDRQTRINRGKPEQGLIEISVTTTQNQTIQNDNKTILIIDDSTNIRHLLARTLQKAGYQVEEASDGLQGLEKLQTALSIKAVICDIDMPNLDGFRFLAKAKAQPNFKHIPIILLTSHTGNRYRNLAFQLGAKAYLCKPYNEYELIKVLNE